MMSGEPINLKDIYGKQYKIELDEAAKYEVNGKNDPWLFQIPCRYGHIYPYSDKFLAFYCIGTKTKGKIIREQPDIELVQDGDIEGVFLFTLDQFNTIAKHAKPKTKRRLSPEHKAKLILAGTAALKSHRNSILNANTATRMKEFSRTDHTDKGMSNTSQFRSDSNEINTKK